MAIPIPLLMSLMSGGGAEGGSGLNPLTAAMGGVPELFKLGLGLSQAARAKKIERQNPRPNYQTPQGFQEFMGIARHRAMDGRLPGQELIENQLGANLSNAIRDVGQQGSGGAERLASIASIYGNQGNTVANMGVQAAQQKLANERALQQALREQAGYQDKEWQMNKYDPYMDAMQKAAGMREGANQNIYSSLKGIGAAAASTIGTNQKPQSFMRQGGLIDEKTDKGLGQLLGFGNKVGNRGINTTPQQVNLGGGLTRDELGARFPEYPTTDNGYYDEFMYQNNPYNTMPDSQKPSLDDNKNMFKYRKKPDLGGF